MIDKFFFTCLLIAGAMVISGTWWAVVPAIPVVLIFPRYMKTPPRLRKPF